MFNLNNPSQGVDIKEYYRNFYSQNKLIVYLMAIALIGLIISQSNFFHIIYNVYLIYFGGIILKQYLGEQKVLMTYIIGGLVGFGIFAISFSDFIATTLSIEAFIGSAAIALLSAGATYSPNMEIQLFLFGKVKIKWVAIALIALDIVNIVGQGEVSRISVIGGAAYGFISIMFLKQVGMNFSNPFTEFFKNKKPHFTSSVNDQYSKTKQETDGEYNQRKKVEQDEIDAILDKIRDNGYDVLSTEEKQKLFNKSKNG